MNGSNQLSVCKCMIIYYCPNRSAGAAGAAEATLHVSPAGDPGAIARHRRGAGAWSSRPSGQESAGAPGGGTIEPHPGWPLGRCTLHGPCGWSQK